MNLFSTAEVNIGWAERVKDVFKPGQQNSPN